MEEITMNHEKDKNRKSIALVIPCYNEEAGLYLLYDKIQETIASLPYVFHILLVDDGSSACSFDNIDQ